MSSDIDIVHDAIYETAALSTFWRGYVLWSGSHINRRRCFFIVVTLINRLHQGRDLIDARYWGLNHGRPWNSEEFDSWFENFSQVFPAALKIDCVLILQQEEKEEYAFHNAMAIGNVLQVIAICS